MTDLQNIVIAKMQSMIEELGRVDMNEPSLNHINLHLDSFNKSFIQPTVENANFIKKVIKGRLQKIIKENSKEELDKLLIYNAYLKTLRVSLHIWQMLIKDIQPKNIPSLKQMTEIMAFELDLKIKELLF